VKSIAEGEKEEGAGCGDGALAHLSMTRSGWNEEEKGKERESAGTLLVSLPEGFDRLTLLASSAGKRRGGEKGGKKGEGKGKGIVCSFGVSGERGEKKMCPEKDIVLSPFPLFKHSVIPS